MSLFNAKYHNDLSVWSLIESIVQDRDEVEKQLAEAGVLEDPSRMSQLAKRLYELNQLCFPIESMRNCLEEVGVLEDILKQELAEQERVEFGELFEEQSGICAEKSRQLYNLLLDNGYLAEEREDETDLEILKFIDYAGPEYAWRLGINIGIDVEEARRRLGLLMGKGFLERVEGNMLGNYHRSKDWIKHMNHTYYRITREGRHYLRRLRREPE